MAPIFRVTKSKLTQAIHRYMKRNHDKNHFYGWWIVTGLSFINFIIGGFCFYGSLVLFPMMIADLNWSRTQISLGFMIQMLMVGASAPLSAWSVTKFGAKATMFLGSVVGAMGLLLMPYAVSVPLFILFFGVLLGMGIAFTINIPLQTVVTFWFLKKRGLALGLVMAGTGLGGFAAPPTLNFIIELGGGDWRTAWLFMGTLMALIAVFVLFVVKNNPTELNQLPDGRASNTEDTGTQEQKTNTKNNQIYRSTTSWTLKEAIKTHQLWLLIIAIVGSQFIWQILITQGPLHLSDRGFSNYQYSLLYGAAIGFSIIGRLGGGVLNDFIEPRSVFLIALVLTFIGSVLFWVVDPESPTTMIYPLASGIAIGAALVTVPNIITNYWGKNAFAPVYGFIFPIMIFCNSIAAPLSGRFYDSDENYLKAMLVGWGLLALAMIAAFFLAPPERLEDGDRGD